MQTALYPLDVSYDSCTTGEDAVSVNREVWVSGLKQLNCRTENKLKNENPACCDVMPCSLVYVYRRFRGACQCAQWLCSIVLSSYALLWQYRPSRHPVHGHSTATGNLRNAASVCNTCLSQPRQNCAAILKMCPLFLWRHTLQ